jgi:hypothetical protein
VGALVKYFSSDKRGKRTVGKGRETNERILPGGLLLPSGGV